MQTVKLKTGKTITIPAARGHQETENKLEEAAEALGFEYLGRKSYKKTSYTQFGEKYYTAKTYKYKAYSVHASWFGLVKFTKGGRSIRCSVELVDDKEYIDHYLAGRLP